MNNKIGDVDEIFAWKDQYCIGVEEIDAAHQKLFSIVRRLLKNLLVGDYEKNKITCVEAVKYLNQYTIQHFAQEEAYQRKIGYGGYETHKRIHRDMREVTIPALEKELVVSNYSEKSLKNFAGVCAAWLTSHIMLEDQAIAGKTTSRWDTDINGDVLADLIASAEEYMKKMFRIKIEPENLNYDAYELDNTIHYFMIFRGKNKDLYRTVVTFERSLLCEALGTVLCKPITTLDEIALSMHKELSQDFVMNFISKYKNDNPVLINDGIVDITAFQKDFRAYHPEISLLWNSKFGHVAFCIKTVKSKAPQS